MKITFFETEAWEQEYLTSKLTGLEATFVPEPLSANNLSLAAGAEIISVFINSRVDENLLASLPALKLIVTRSTGFDHLDLAACARRGITVCNVPFYGENTVAEHTFALILALSRNVHKAYVKTLKGDYSLEGLRGFDLKGKTIGVVGAGHIGLHVIRVAKSFGMKVLAYDPNQDTFLQEILDFEYVSLANLLGHSDIITLHVPLNEHTHHLINRESIKEIKRGALLINTSRGGVVETEALLTALEQKIISGAGLDVLEGEELIKEEKQLLVDPAKTATLGQIVKNHILLNQDNVVFTPHVAFYSQEALERILNTTLENIRAFAQNQPRNVVKG